MSTISAGRAGALLAALALAVAGCSTESGSSSGGEGWSHTTAFGNTVSLDAPPDTVVVDAYSAAALWDYGVRPAGVYGYGITNGLGLGDADLDSMTVVGTDAVFETEVAANMGADLVVGYSAETDPTSWIWWEAAQAEQINVVAPFLGIDPSSSLDGTLDQYRSLAASLGADVDSPEIASDRADYDAAKQRVRDAVAANPGVTVLPVNAAADAVYIGTEQLSVLGLLSDLGVSLAGPGFDGPWATVSWENVAQYPADIVLEYPASREVLDASPVYGSIPAVTSGDVLDWDDKRPTTYAEYADWLDRLADAVDRSSSST
ncbi:ABC transporter substrate-binding protein [Rhodococcus sp. BP-241]|uniref:ABC transporter substrate-binding protein n=1 Tax=Rhodococcus sp. BP-241 TaxID=2739441 RepID=UPI001C9A879A|nr:ABC transporter substrate-binding protein [Rhodococcus sp. BP-241]MBY6707550.1 ABC transporter substrate-binding protein [Rhodococcus sp. BP-241]